jgi:hypothetical protein
MLTRSEFEKKIEIVLKCSNRILWSRSKSYYGRYSQEYFKEYIKRSLKEISTSRKRSLVSTKIQKITTNTRKKETHSRTLLTTRNQS